MANRVDVAGGQVVAASCHELMAKKGGGAARGRHRAALGPGGGGAAGGRAWPNRRPAASTTDTETWAGQGGAVGGKPEATDQAG